MQVEKKAKTETEEPQQSLEIEYETVTLRIPKKIMDFLRSMEKPWNQTPTEYLEYQLIDEVRADLEAATGEEFIAWFDLATVFYQVLGDKRYKKKD